MAEKWSQALRIVEDVPTLLQFLMFSKGKITKPAWLSLFQRTKKLCLQRHCITLPLSISIPYPVGSSHLPELQTLLIQFIQQLQGSLFFKKWVLFVIRWVPTRGKTVKATLCEPVHTYEDMQLKAWSTESCACFSFPQNLQRFEGCLCIRGISQMTSLFGLKSTAVIQNMSNVLPCSWSKLLHGLKITLNALHTIGIPPAPLKIFWLRFLTLHKLRYDTFISSLPPEMKPSYICQVRDSFPSLQFVPVDKNPGSIVLICKKLYMKLINKQLFSPQHSFVRSFQTVEHCTGLSTRLLLAEWSQFKSTCKLPPFKILRKSCVPHVYFMIKNKSQEWNDILKVRLIYSYYKHPLKPLATLMSRVLSILLKLVVEHLPTMEIIDMRQIKSWTIDNNQYINQYPPSYIRWLRLCELDIAEMFPSIRKNKLMDSIIYLRQKLEVKLRKRKCTKPWEFALHKRFRQLDKTGRCDSSQFTMISWETLLRFLEWDLQRNNLFHFSSHLWMQVKGVPIGGPLSSQLASLFCCACEIHATTLSLNQIWFGRPLRFRDNVLFLIGPDMSSTELLLRFWKRYGLKFTTEQRSQKIQSLEADLTLICTPTTVTLNLRWKLPKMNVPEPRQEQRRFVDPHSLNIKPLLRSYIPAAAQKCHFYALDMES